MSRPRQSNPQPSEGRIIADTATSPVGESDGIAAEILVNNDLVMVQHRTVHAGPLPDPATLQGLVDIYPEAAKIIFDNFHAQSVHRRDLEKLRLTTSSSLALRSQIIGGALGVIGLIGSFVVAALGREWAASAIGSVSLVSLVSVFVLGRDQQKRERVEKVAAQQKIRHGLAVEQVGQAAPSGGAGVKSPRVTANPKPKKSS